MEKDTNNNMRLGIFVLSATIILIVAMYFIGAKQSLFTSTFRISAIFTSVEGLLPGNNVRFAGIDIGTVEKVEILNDSSVQVVLLIENDSRKFIKKNALAGIGTDGLMGNKLVNINSVREPGLLIEEGDVLKSIHPIETKEMLRTLNRTNEDVSLIARNLRMITDRLYGTNALWSILMDSTVAENIKNAIVNIRITGERSAIITGDLSNIVHSIKSGKGTLGALITDTVLSHKINQTIVRINLISDTLAYISGDMNYVSGKIRNGESAVGTLLMDTTFVNNLNQTMLNLRNGTKGLEENMEALKGSFLLRKYFRKQEKKKK